MGSRLKNTVARSVALYRTGRARKFLERKACRILMYHAIDHAIHPEDDPMGLVIPPGVFSMQMQCLRDRRMRVIPLSDLVKTIEQRGAVPERAIVITFDDGYQGVLTHAWPLLKRFGFAATLFANIGFIERTLHTRFYWSAFPTLTWDDLRLLCGEGMAIGSHGLAHRRLDGMSDKEASEDIRQSKALIEKNLGETADLFSYPGGAFSEKIIGILKEAGFSSSCSSIGGMNDSETDPFVLRRTEVTAFDNTPEKFERKLLGCYDWTAWIR